MRVSIMGSRGSFHEMAARQFFPQVDLEVVPCTHFEAAMRASVDGTADAAVVAIENSLSGGLIRNFELIRKFRRRILGEVYLRIRQNLLALPGQRMEDIREVRTHYMAINQTRDWFEANCPWIRMVESESTSQGAAVVAAEKLTGVGAVASRLSAELYGLEILAEGIETYKDNFTRFLVLGPQEAEPVGDADKSTLCFTLPHKPGALAQILTVLSFYEMNLTRIQSLPIPGKVWQYFFYADIKFDDYARYLSALTAVRPLLEDLEILGEYKAGL